MNIQTRRFLGACIVSLMTLASVSIGAADRPYHFLKSIPVGGDGGWDSLSIDEAGRSLYVSHGNSVVVIDIDKDAVVGEIANTQGVNGLAPAPDLQRGFV